jgi:Na+/phosphate symporter
MLVIAGGILLAFFIMAVLRNLGRIFIVFGLLALIGYLVGP